MDGRDNGATASLFRLPIRIELGSVTVPYSEIQSAFISSISVTCPGLPWISGEVFWLLAPLRCVRDRFWLWLWPSGKRAQCARRRESVRDRFWLWLWPSLASPP